MSDVLREARDAARAIAKLSEPRGGRDTAWGTVVAVKGPRVDVMIGGTVSGALRYTRGCEGMAEGDRVMVQFVGREPVVVNVISDGESSREHVIFEDAQGSYNKVIELSQDVSQLRYLDVFAVTNEGYKIFTRVDSPKVGTVFFISGGSFDGKAYAKGKAYEILGERSINTHQSAYGGSYVTYEWNSLGGVFNQDKIGITKIIGVK